MAPRSTSQSVPGSRRKPKPVSDATRALLDEMTQAPILKATKCDLCIDQLGGPACARACPHDALVRMDMRDVDRLANWINR